MTMRTFTLQRTVDISGVSGTGVVAEGVEFSDGTAALRWRSGLASTAVYASVEDLVAIHGHHGATTVVWLDPAGAVNRADVDAAIEQLGRELTTEANWEREGSEAGPGQDQAP